MKSLILDELPKKLMVLGIIRDRGEDEAFRLYPEMQEFILQHRGLDYETAKARVLNKPNADQ